MSDLPFSCSCGSIAGTLRDVGRKQGDRYVCYCNDCRDFARYLGVAEEVLDSAGGSSVYQTRVDHLEIAQGVDHLACINLAGKETLRWFCRDCHTPLFNTTNSGKWPFLSMITTGCDAGLRDRVLGAPRGSVFAQFATGPDVVTPPISAFTMIRRVIVRLFADKFGGAGKRYALFDSVSKQPIAAPLALSDTEKRALGRD